METASSEWTTDEILATLAGTLASICFTLQYVCIHSDFFCAFHFVSINTHPVFVYRYLPQAWLNYQRQSVKGFYTIGIIIKLVGACFLTINAYLTGGSCVSGSPELLLLLHLRCLSIGQTSLPSWISILAF